MTGDRLELDQRQVTVARQMQVYAGQRVLTTPKAEKVRTVIVPNLVAVELRRHLRDHVAEGVLFRGLRGAEMLRRDQFYASVAAGAESCGVGRGPVQVPLAQALLRQHVAGRGCAGHRGGRAPGRHGRDADAGLRPLAPGRPRGACRCARLGARSTGRATSA